MLADELTAQEPTRAVPQSAEGFSGERASAAKPRKKATWKSWLKEFVIVLVCAILMSMVLRMFVAQMFEIPSGSMENTLRVDDRIIVRKVGPAPQRGDVVVFQDFANWASSTPTHKPGFGRRILELIGLAPDSSHTYLVKRIIGMPGDKVACCDAQGRVTVNDVALDEHDYLFTDSNGVQNPPSEHIFTVVVPAGRVFVMGDHRSNSWDSRCHLSMGIDAFVPLDKIEGSVWMVVLPFQHAKTMQRPHTLTRIPAPTQAAPAEPVIQPADAHC